MHRLQFFTLATAVYGLAACGPFPGQRSVPPVTGDQALRTHGHDIHAIPALETGMATMASADTAAIATPSTRDTVAAASRARTDSLEQARFATLAAANRARADSLQRTSTALREELAELIHFDLDRAEIQPTDRVILNHKAAILSANPTVRVRIAGYCDERGSDEHNLALGNRRAAAAKQYLIGQGIDAGRLDVTSLGRASPVNPGRNEVAWAMNRRAAFEITSGDGMLTEPAASARSVSVIEGN